jgi:hypothetical protein
MTKQQIESEITHRIKRIFNVDKEQAQTDPSFNRVKNDLRNGKLVLIDRTRREVYTLQSTLHET